MKKLIAYTESPNLKDPASLAALYSEIDIHQTYFEITSDLILQENSGLWKQLGQPVDTDKFFYIYYPEWVNAIYWNFDNNASIYRVDNV